jgi:hypothetical protein
MKKRSVEREQQYVGIDLHRRRRSTSLDGPFIPNRLGNYWSGWCLAIAADDWYMAGGARHIGVLVVPWSSLTGPRADTWLHPSAIGRAISTPGDSSQALPIYDFSFGPTTPGYLGWVMPVTASVPQDL